MILIKLKHKKSLEVVPEELLIKKQTLQEKKLLQDIKVKDKVLVNF